MKLTKQQLKFAQAKLAGKNNRQAAIAAGCNESSAAQAGYRMNKSKAINAYIEYQKAVISTSHKHQPEKAIETTVPVFDFEFADPKGFLFWVMNNKDLDVDMRMRAARDLMPYEHGKQKTTSAMPTRTVSKKEETQQAANSASTGLFGTADKVGTLQ